MNEDGGKPPFLSSFQKRIVASKLNDAVNRGTTRLDASVLLCRMRAPILAGTYRLLAVLVAFPAAGFHSHFSATAYAMQSLSSM